MKNTKKLLAVILALALALSMLAGCGDSNSQGSANSANSGNSASQGSDNSASQGADASSGDAGVVTYYSMWTESEPQAVALAQMAEAFEAETGTHVEITWVGRDVLTSAKNLLLSNQAPDIIDHDCSELYSAFLADEVMVQSVDDLLEGSLKGAFRDEQLSFYQKDGKNYFIPYSYITSGFYYNKTEWAEMNLTPPSTWSELIACAEAFKAAGKDFLQVDCMQPDYAAYYYYTLCERILGSGALLEAANDTTGASWDNPGFLKAAELVYELSQGGSNYFGDGYSGNVWPNGQSAFAMGGVGALICGSWIPTELSSLVDTDWEWGYFPMPAVEGYDGSVYDMESYLIGWSIPNGAPNADGAKQFIEYCSSKENADLYVEVGLNMSARADTEFPAVLSDIENYLSNAESFYLSFDGVAAFASEWTNNVFYPADMDLLAGKITPEQFIERVKTETIAFYGNK